MRQSALAESTLDLASRFTGCVPMAFIYADRRNGLRQGVHLALDLEADIRNLFLNRNTLDASRRSRTSNCSRRLSPKQPNRQCNSRQPRRGSIHLSRLYSVGKGHEGSAAFKWAARSGDRRRPVAIPPTPVRLFWLFWVSLVLSLIH